MNNFTFIGSSKYVKKHYDGESIIREDNQKMSELISQIYKSDHFTIEAAYKAFTGVLQKNDC